MIILATRKNWKGQIEELEEESEHFIEFFAKYKFGSFFTSRKSVAEVIAVV